jgi:hypothetical protein
MSQYLARKRATTAIAATLLLILLLPPLLMAAFMLDIMNPWGCCRWPSDDSLLYHG